MAADPLHHTVQESRLSHLWRAAAWKARTAAQKRLIYLQDRFRWYSYTDWIANSERAGQVPDDVGAPRPDWGYQPLVSLLVAGHQSDTSLLAHTLRSIAAQTYPHWEVCLAAPAETHGNFTEWLGEGHVRLIAEPKTSACGSILSLLAASQGEFVCALAAGDAISPYLLAEVVGALNAEEGADIIYFDEDHLAAAGDARCQPFFKPDWSPELLLSTNYLVHAVFRRSLLARLAADQEAQDDQSMQALALRSSLAAGKIVHIPKVLFHQGAPLQAETPPAKEIILSQVEAYMRRRGVPNPTASFSPTGEVRLAWPTPGHLVSIIIPTCDHLADLQACLDSLRQLTDYPAYEILLVDTGSRLEDTHRYYAELTETPGVSIIPYEGEFNFSAALNLGAAQARGSVLVFLNNDTQIVDPDWLEELTRWAELPEIGVVGALLLHPQGAVQHAGIIIGMEGHASHIFAGASPQSSGPFGSAAWYRNYSAVTGACLAMRQQVFQQIGRFNEGYQLAFSDVDLCQNAIRAGYRVMVTPYARLIHREGSTRRGYIPPGDMQRGYVRLAELARKGDPFYNPNLSYAVRQPTLRRPREDNPLERLEAILRFSNAFPLRKQPV